MEPEDGNEIQIIRSEISVEKAYVTFANYTNHELGVYWMDFGGNPQLYIRLRPSGVVELNTFRSHAWIFCDTYTGEAYQVRRQSVFWAQPYFVRDPRNQNQIIPARRRFAVHVPLRTLRENVMWFLARRLTNVSEDAIKGCELPNVLKDELLLVLRKVVDFRTTADLVPSV